METAKNLQSRKVFCPVHKAAFDAPPQPRVVCEIVEHVLTDNLARAEYWEYCCNCQTYWPSLLGQGGPAAVDCPSCGRDFVRHYLCHECKLLSVESDEAAKGKIHSITTLGISPTCPNCESAPGLGVQEHRCEEAQALLLSADTTCRFCEVSLVKGGLVASKAASLPDKAQPVNNASADTTVIIPAPHIQQPIIQIRQGVHPLFAYSAVGLLALVIGGAVIAWMKSGSNIQSNVSAKPKIEATTTVSSEIGQKTAIAKEPRDMRSSVDADAKPQQQLTEEAVRTLLVSWERAQENKDFAIYQACYDSSFAGVKVTKRGSSKTYSYGGWMADRRRMITNAVNLNVDITNLRIKVEGNTAIAEFDQYYRSLRYSDWGPKEIRLKLTPSGAKIIYEALKASYPL